MDDAIVDDYGLVDEDLDELVDRLAVMRNINIPKDNLDRKIVVTLKDLIEAIASCGKARSSPIN